MKRTISDLMLQRDISNPPTISHTANISEALHVLRQNDAGALIVMNGAEVIGVFSERDIARAYASSEGELSPLTNVKRLMTKKVVYVTTDYQLDECMAIMSKMKIRHLPVFSGETLTAFLSMRHIMEALVEEKQFMLGQLVTYITGTNEMTTSKLREGLVKNLVL